MTLEDVFVTLSAMYALFLERLIQRDEANIEPFIYHTGQGCPLNVPGLVCRLCVKARRVCLAPPQTLATIALFGKTVCHILRALPLKRRILVKGLFHDTNLHANTVRFWLFNRPSTCEPGR